MAFGTNNIQPTSGKRGGFGRFNFSSNLGRNRFGNWFAFGLKAGKPHFQIAAKLNIGSAASHIGGNRHRTGHASISNDFGFFFMETGIQNPMLDFTLFQFG